MAANLTLSQGYSYSYVACTSVLYTVYYFTKNGKQFPICKLYATPEAGRKYLEMKLIKYFIYLLLKQLILVTSYVFKK